MRIKTFLSESFLPKTSAFIKNKKITIIFVTLAILFVSGGTIMGILWKRGILQKVAKNLPYVINGVILNPPERITIDIKFKDYQKLVEKREEGLKNEFFVSSEEDYVPAVITHRDKKINSQLRLKGDHVIDMITGDKWSFRVKVRDDETLFGMRRFSLHRPSARFYVSEWVFHKMLEYEGLIALRYDFVNVTVNGKDLGLYAIEEHFGKQLIENNQLREGMIIQYDDDLYFGSSNHNAGSSLRYVVRGLGYHSVEMRPYELGRILRTPNLRRQFRRANELAARFRLGELEYSQVFDVKKAAKYYALCDLTGATHNVGFSNFKTYYNPITGLLEPIGFDVSNALTIFRRLTGERYMKRKNDTNNYHWDRILPFWDDEKLGRAYLGQVERMIQPAFIDQIFADISEPLKEKVALLWNLGIKEGIYAQSHDYVKRILHSNAKAIRKQFSSLKGPTTYLVKVSGESLIVLIKNIEVVPVEIEKITYKDTVIAKPRQPVIVRPQSTYSPDRFQRYVFDVPQSFKWDDWMIADVAVHSRVLGTSYTFTKKIFAWDHSDEEFFTKELVGKKPSFHNNKFFVIDPKAKTINIKPGRWTIRKDIVIPPGWQVVAHGGVVLDLKNRAKIVSQSSFEWTGTEDQQIQLISSDGTGQGLVIMNTSYPSNFKYVIFKNLSTPRHMDAAVTFYAAEVNISQCQFLNNRFGNSLNIIRSYFVLEDSLFKKASHDAISVDLACGTITHVAFFDSGHDAINFSGSNVVIKRNVIDQVENNAVTIGEESDISVIDTIIKRCKIGIAGRSHIRSVIKSTVIEESDVGLAIYQGATQMSQTKVRAENLTIIGVSTPYVVDVQSELMVDGQKIAADAQGAKEPLLSLR